MKTKFAGSGSTWVRYLIECASGVFTGCIINCLHSNLFLHLEYKGSVYKDLELQLKGYWGEIRDWRDGTTIVQKTHDSGPELIRLVFFDFNIIYYIVHKKRDNHTRTDAFL